MFMTIEVHHAIEPGMEKEALQVVKDLHNDGLDYPGNNILGIGLLVRNGNPGLEVNDYREHLGKVFSRVNRVTNKEARIKVHLTA